MRLIVVPVLYPLLLDFALIAVLPRIFFRSGGDLNARWWLTAFPFGACPVFVVCATASGWQPLGPDALRPVLPYAALTLILCSVGLITMALGSHSAPVALWHQEDDAPLVLVTHGAYARIRHPLYSAFLLALLAAFLLLPHVVTLAALGYGCAVLRATAVREERRLTGSVLGAEYGRYMARTGRFVPPLRLPSPGRPAERGEPGGAGSGSRVRG